MSLKNTASLNRRTIPKFSSSVAAVFAAGVADRGADAAADEADRDREWDWAAFVR
jgi:hypothetical protein